jgi:hypothetical protein
MAALYRLDGIFRAGRHNEVVEALEQLYSAGSSTRGLTIHRWVRYVTQLISADPLELVPYVELLNRVFPKHVESATAAAAALVALGKWQVVLDEYTDQHVQFVAACNLLGEFELVVKAYSDVPWLRDTAVLRLNDFDDAKLMPEYVDLAHLFRGDVDVTQPGVNCTEARLIRGEFERLLEQTHLDVDHRRAALRGLKRVGEAMEYGDERTFVETEAGVEALERCSESGPPTP